MPTDWSQKQNRSYLVWRFGKFPEVVIEIVSNRKGNELVRKDPEKPHKKEAYARMGIAYYAVFDPLQQIQEAGQMDGQPLKVFELRGKRYVELSQPLWMDGAGLGLTLWNGEFEGVSSQWLRWCDRPLGAALRCQEGQVIPTGAERADIERQEKETERQEKEAERLAERLRELGVNPDEI